MSLAGWVKEICGAVVYDNVCHEFWGYRGGYSVSAHDLFRSGVQSHCISSCWRKRLRAGVAFLVQQAGEKAVTRGKDIFPKVSDKE